MSPNSHPSTTITTPAAFANHVISEKNVKLNMTGFHAELASFVKGSRTNSPLKAISDNVARAEYFYAEFGQRLNGLIARVLLNEPPQEGCSSSASSESPLHLLQKSDLTSIEFKTIGNALYKQKNLDKALRAYTLACCYAPAGSTALALGLSNRSACLTEQKRYAEALQDIRRFEAVAGACDDDPQLRSIVDRLAARKARCLESMTIQMPKAPQEFDQFFKLTERNERVPSAEAFVGIAVDGTRGRHLRNMGEEPIQPGTLLILEEPFSKILLNAYKFELEHCTACLKDLGGGGVPCTGCVFHVFCSEACSLTQNGYECRIAPFLYELNMDRTEHLALETLLKLPVSEIVSEWEITAKKVSSAEVIDGFSGPVYESNSYHAINRLMYHEQLISEQDLRQYLTYGTVVAHLLSIRTDYFGSDSDRDKTSFISSVLLHLMNFPCNAHALYKMDSSGSRGYEEIGAGAFALLSMINHSCDPNVVRVTLPDGAVGVVAIGVIMPGEEVLDCYGPHYAVQGRGDRVRHILEHYNFRCGCNACVNDWAEFRALLGSKVESITRVCGGCRRSVVEAGGWIACGADGGCGWKLPAADWDSEFEHNVSLLDTVVEDLGEGRAWEGFVNARSGLRWFDSRVRRPWRDVNKFQEVMKQCLFMGVRAGFRVGT